MKKILILFYLTACSLLLYGQHIERELYSSGGAVDESGSAKVSWTIGEAFTESLHGNSAELNQGFQQYQYVVTFISEDLANRFEIYPNPVTDVLYIDYPDHSLYIISVYDGQGRILKKYQNETQINFGKYPAGMYFINISGNNTIEKYQIIKK